MIFSLFRTLDADD